MAPREAAFERRVEASYETVVDTRRDERGRFGIAIFLGGSVAAHALAWVVLAALPSAPIDLFAESTTLAFDVIDPEPVLEPLPEPEAPREEPTPEPEPVVVPPRPREVREPEPAPAIEEAPVGDEAEPVVPGAVPAESVGVTSTEGGLAVNAQEGGGGSGPLVLRAQGGRADGAPSGVGEGPAIDHRRLAREWMERVNRAIMERALRDYPRAARRAHLEGTVVVSIAVAPDGKITGVEVERGTGNETLDRAALAAVQAVGTLPSPPDVFNQRHRPLTMPIRYRFQ
jgi:protein TonB